MALSLIFGDDTSTVNVIGSVSPRSVLEYSVYVTFDESHAAITTPILILEPLLT
jgi:hypothetical protein